MVSCVLKPPSNCILPPFAENCRARVAAWGAVNLLREVHKSSTVSWYGLSRRCAAINMQQCRASSHRWKHCLVSIHTFAQGCFNRLLGLMHNALLPITVLASELCKRQH